MFCEHTRLSIPHKPLFSRKQLDKKPFVGGCLTLSQPLQLKGQCHAVCQPSPSANGGPPLSQQNQKPHGKNITAKPKTSRQKQNTTRQNQKPHGKNNLTEKPNTSQQKQNSFGFAVRSLVLP